MFILLISLIQFTYFFVYMTHIKEGCGLEHFPIGLPSNILEQEESSSATFCTNQEFIRFGGSWIGDIQKGHVWQLLSVVMTHASVSHVVGNIIGQLAVGWRLEQAIGSLWMVILYALTGIFASLTHYAFFIGNTEAKGIQSVLVGCSGAVCGVWGVAAAFMIMFWSLLKKDIRRRRLCALFLFPLITEIIMTFINEKDNVAHGAHLGGFVCGFYLTIAITKFSKLGEKDEELRSFFGINSLIVRGFCLVPPAMFLALGAAAIASAEKYDAYEEAYSR